MQSGRRTTVLEMVVFAVFLLTAVFALFVCMIPVNEYEGMGESGIDCDSVHHILLPLPCAFLIAGALIFARLVKVHGRTGFRVFAIGICLATLVPSGCQICASLREQQKCDEVGR